MIALSIKIILKSKSLHLIKLGNKFVSAELSNFIIDLEQLKLNWRWLDTLTHTNCITAGVVKANAYGHGLGTIATSLFEAGCRIFCVARLEEALELLAYSTKKGAAVIKKVLNSAIANAEHNEGADVDELKVSTICVDEGMTMKRIMPRAKGRADRILKRSCHITITVADS